MRKRLGVYEKRDFDKLIDLIGREDANELNVSKLMRSLKTFVDHFALPKHLREEQQIWAEFAAKNKMKPTESVRALKVLRKAQNPLAPGACPEGVKAYLNAKLSKRFDQRLRKGMSTTRRSLIRDNWADLPNADRDEVFRAIEELLVYFKIQVTPGAPSKDRLDAALWSIVEIWAEQTGCKDKIGDPPFDIAHKENSRFIQFATIAMQPCGAKTETTQSAMSWRWRRMKQHAEEGAE